MKRPIRSSLCSCDVSFERFAAAVRDVLGDQPVAAREGASLRLLLRHARELRGLETLLPLDERTESTPLVERFKEMLDGSQEPAETTAGAAEKSCRQLLKYVPFRKSCQYKNRICVCCATPSASSGRAVDLGAGFGGFCLALCEVAAAMLGG